MKLFQIIICSTILLINSFGCTAIKERLPKKQIQPQGTQGEAQEQTEQKRKVDPIPINPQHS